MSMYVITLHVLGQKFKTVATVFLRSDAAATIYFAAHFVQLLFEGGVLESLKTSTTAG